MKKSFEVELPGKIEDYEKLLSKYNNWKKYKREINLNQILEDGKKIEFEIEVLNNQSVSYIKIYNKNDAIDSLLRNACASITKMKFIILNNKVLNLTVYCSKLSTNSGKILENNIKSDIDLKLYQNKDIEGQIIDFYFINELV
jgi:roadblock/LC7 domain-containing protein